MHANKKWIESEISNLRGLGWLIVCSETMYNTSAFLGIKKRAHNPTKLCIFECPGEHSKLFNVCNCWECERLAFRICYFVAVSSYSRSHTNKLEYHKHDRKKPLNTHILHMFIWCTRKVVLFFSWEIQVCSLVTCGALKLNALSITTDRVV